MGESVAGNNAATAVDEAEDAGDASTKKSVFSTFADLGVDPSDVGMENEEDFGGLMVSSFISYFHRLLTCALRLPSKHRQRRERKTRRRRRRRELTLMQAKVLPYRLPMALDPEKARIRKTLLQKET